MPSRSTLAFVLALLGAAHAEAQALTPEEAVAMLVRSSPSLRAADADVRAAEASVESAVGARVPTLVTTATGQTQENYVAIGGMAPSVISTSSSGVSGDVSLAYTTELGTQITVGVSAASTWSTRNLTAGTAQSVSLGPIYSASTNLSARQPLLRGAGDDATLSATREAEASRTAAERTRDQTLSQAVLDVLSAYWELWYAQRAVRVQEEALALAERQYEEQRIRLERLGTAAPADLLQLATQRASIQEQLALARSTERTRAIALAQAMGTEASQGGSFVATGDPPEGTEPPAVPRLAALARDASAELLALSAQVDAARQRARGAADANQPRLDLVGSASMGGVWNGASDNVAALPNGRPAFGASIGLELELPLGTSQYAAQHDAALAQLDAAEERYEARVRQLAAEMATLRTEVETAGQQVDLATETARVARELAEAEAQRLSLGTSTPLTVVTAQQSARESELRRLRAIIDRVIAELGLAHRTGQLLVVANREARS